MFMDRSGLGSSGELGRWLTEGLALTSHRPPSRSLAYLFVGRLSAHRTCQTLGPLWSWPRPPEPRSVDFGVLPLNGMSPPVKAP